VTPDNAQNVPREAALRDAQEWWCEQFHRPAGRWLAKWLINTRVTPGQVIFVGGLCGVLAGALLIAGTVNPMLCVAAGFFLMCASILDCADGDLARARNEQSLLGMIRDGINDNVVGTSVFVGMSYNMVTETGNPWLWLLGIAAGVSTSAHALSFDARRKQYMQILKLVPPAEVYSVSRVEEMRKLARQEGRRADALLLWGYRHLRKTQNITIREIQVRDLHRFWLNNRGRMQAWGPMGSSTHFTLIYVAAFVAPFWPQSFIAAAIIQAGLLNLLYVVLLMRPWKTA
jgi:phosphatidylglycerophosphate synthase